LDDLSGDLQDIMTVLHTHTGAEIWALGVWRDLQGDLHYTEYVSAQNVFQTNRVHRALSTASDAFQAERRASDGCQGFVEFQLSRNCKL
jgi:hypothetical protein